MGNCNKPYSNFDMGWFLNEFKALKQYVNEDIDKIIKERITELGAVGVTYDKSAERIKFQMGDDQSAGVDSGDKVSSFQLPDNNIVKIPVGTGGNSLIIPGENTMPDGTTFHLIAGVIRQNNEEPTKWNYLDNEGHKPMGVKNTYAEASSNAIKITFDREYDRVVSFVCSPDEYFAQRCVTIGASVGLGYATLNLGTTSGISGNIYYDGSKWVSQNLDGYSTQRTVTLTNSGELRLVHEDIGAPYSEYLLSPLNSAVDITGLYTPMVNYSGNSATQTVFRFMTPAGNVITNGTATTKMTFRYYIGGQRPFIVDGTRGVWSAGNIWFSGIMAKYPT